MVYSVYARHGANYASKKDSVEEAIRVLNYGDEYGECYALGVYDAENNIVHLPDNAPVHVSEEALRPRRLKLIRQLCKLPPDHEFAGIQTYYRMEEN